MDDIASTGIVSANNSVPPTRPPIKKIGITQLLPSNENNKIVADICFVHGLGGHPQKTWQYGDEIGEELTPAKKSFRIFRNRPWSKKEPDRAQSRTTSGTVYHTTDSGHPVQSSPRSRHNYCYWPFDLVSENFPDCRVLVYGYDSHVTHFYTSERGETKKTNQMTISQHSRQLLRAVTDHRGNCRGRPLIFVVHSLGGILVKDIIIESRKPDQQDDAKDVASSCIAIMFFGTPHQGADIASMGQIVSRLVSVLPFAPSMNTKILRGLRPNSEKLEQVNLDFNGVLDQMGSSGPQMKLYSFREGQGYSSLTGLDSKVVPDYSSFFGRRNIEKESFVMKNHMDMCKLAPHDDALADTYYHRFVPAVEEYLRTLDRQSISVAGQTAAVLKRCFEYAGRRDRIIQLQELHLKPASFEWLWVSAFASWLSTSDPTFWIQGAPASGKSTLMLHIAESERTLDLLRGACDEDWLPIYHFFDFRANDRLANNFSGALRSLILQILSSVPGLAQKPLSLTLLSNLEGLTDSESLHQLPVSVCRQVLIDMLRECGRNVFILLDGLDEYCGDIVTLVELLNDFSNLQNLKVCIASRRTNLLDFMLGNKPQLCMHKVNRSGILAWTKDQFHSFFACSPSGSSYPLDKVADDLAERSQGIFLWARFAVEQVITGFSQGQDIESKILARRLQAVPEKLQEIYARIVSEIPQDFKAFAALALVLNSTAVQPISTEFTRVVMQRAPKTSGILSDAVQVAIELDNTQRFELAVRGSTGGLCEILPATGPHDTVEPRVHVIRLIHRSVDIFLEERGWHDFGLKGNVHAFADEIWMNLLAAELLQSQNILRAVLGTNDDESYTSMKNAYSVCQYRDPWSEPHNVDENFEAIHSALTIPYSGFAGKMNRHGPRILAYAVSHIFTHAARFEHESLRSSYSILRDAMTPELAKLHYRIFDGMCRCQRLRFCRERDWKCPSEAVHIVVAHGLERYLDEYLSLGPEVQEPLPLTNMARYVNEKDTDQDIVGSKQDSSWTRKEMALSWALEYAIFTPNPESYSTLRVALRHHTLFSDLRLLSGVAYSSLQVVEVLLSLHPPRAFKAALNVHATTYVNSHLINHLRLLNNATSATFRPFWGIGRRSIEGTAAVIDQLVQAGENINDICGPFGTVLHSLIDTLPSRGRTEELLDLLLLKGASVHISGPYGNALEFAWWVATYYPWKEKYAWSIAAFLKRLIRAGAVNRRAGPDGRIPSHEEMFNW